MSMFDYVAFSIPCPRCTEVITNFQSKDGPRDLQVFLPHMVKEMTGYCDNEECRETITFVDGKQTWPTYDAGSKEYPIYLPIPPDGRPWKR